MPSKSKPDRAAAATRVPLTVSRPELLVDGSDAKFRKLVHDLFALASRHEAVRAGHGARIGLTGIEYTVLISVLHLEEDGPVNVKTVSDHLHVSGPFATAMIRKLIARGLVRKMVDPEDRRRVRLDLTDAGLRLLQDLSPLQQQVNNVQFGCLNELEFQILSGMVKKLIDSSEDALGVQDYLKREIPLKKKASGR